jgi:hypothetical protein
MSARRPVRRIVVAVLLGVLVGGGLMAVTPAGAEVSQAVATNWKKIWKKNLKPLADKRYYTKKQSDAKYQAKGNYEAAGSGYTKAETYSKAEADAKYAKAPTVIRGAFSIRQTSDAAGELMSNPISFGVTLAAAPTVHLIDGGAVPSDCSGTATNPGAAPGHLCVFVSTNINTSNATIYSAGGISGTASPFGAYIGASATAAGQSYYYGGWALGVGTLAAGDALAKAPSGAADGH